MPAAPAPKPKPLSVWEALRPNKCFPADADNPLTLPSSEVAARNRAAAQKRTASAHSGHAPCPTPQSVTPTPAPHVTHVALGTDAEPSSAKGEEDSCASGENPSPDTCTEPDPCTSPHAPPPTALSRHAFLALVLRT